MKLDSLHVDRLVVAKTNMRSGKKPDLTDILPSIRARGVLQSLVVRPLADSDLYEVVAGSRRYLSSKQALDERRAAGEAEDERSLLPCGIMEAGDDAAAVEASLIENHARLDPDEVTQWEGFVRLVKEGRDIDHIAATFGITEQRVKRILALGNLLPRIRNLYRKGEIDAATVKHLTLASKSQQRDWLALIDDPEAHAPVGHNLKNWLFGGASIPVKHALFDTTSYAGQIVADLFGEDGYFGEADLFWDAQNAAIEAKREAYVEEGWSDVVILGPGENFHSWDYRKAPKKKGGRVYVDVRANGETIFHEGFVTEKEANRIERGEKVGQGQKPARAELTSALTTYIDLHRHAAARAALLSAPRLALRLLVAHAMLGSSLWALRIEPQSARSDDIAESLELSPGECLFDAKRRDSLGLLSLSAEEPTLVGTDAEFAALFTRVMEMDDEAVLGIIAIIMGETLASGSVGVELIGLTLNIDMADWWEADEAFFALLRDRQVLGELVGDVAGSTVAKANAKEKTKVLKQIVHDYLEGADRRERRARWVPRWMQFPPAAYTDRGGVATVIAHDRATRFEPLGAEEPIPPDQSEAEGLAGGADDAAVQPPEDEARLAA